MHAGVSRVPHQVHAVSADTSAAFAFVPAEERRRISGVHEHPTSFCGLVRGTHESGLSSFGDARLDEGLDEVVFLLRVDLRQIPAQTHAAVLEVADVGEGGLLRQEVFAVVQIC